MEKYKVLVELDTSEAMEVLNGGTYNFSSDELLDLEKKIKGDLRQCSYCDTWVSEIDECWNCGNKLKE